MTTPPGGGLLVTDGQFQLDETLMGDFAPVWSSDEDGWSLFGSNVIDQDVERALGRGSRANRDRTGSRLFTCQLRTVEARLSEAEANVACEALETLFDSSGTTDKILWLRIAGLGTRYLIGRPRGAVIDTKRIADGLAFALVTFKANDPTLWRPT